MKRNYTTLISVGILLIFTIITYFGRIYFTDIFHPERITFFWNFIILTEGFIVGGLVLGLVSWVIYLILKELIKDIMSLLGIKLKLSFDDILKEIKEITNEGRHVVIIDLNKYKLEDNVMDKLKLYNVNIQNDGSKIHIYC